MLVEVPPDVLPPPDAPPDAWPGLTPEVGPVIHHIQRGATYVWDDVWQFMKDGWEEDWKGALEIWHLFGGDSGLKVSQVETMIEAAAQRLLESISGFWNIAQGYTHAVFNTLNDLVNALQDYTIQGLDDLWTPVLALEDYAYSAVAQLQGEITLLGENTLTLVNQAVNAAVVEVKDWTYTNVFLPLAADIAALGDRTLTLVGQTAESLQAQIDNLASRTLGLVEQTGAALQAEIDQQAAAELGLVEQVGAALQSQLDTIERLALPAIETELGILQQTETGLTTLEIPAILSELGVLQSTVSALSQLAVPALATEVSTLTKTVTDLQTFNDECGVPMCEQLGPGTDLSKWLDALKKLLGLLAGLTLAGVTEPELERWAALFAQHVEAGTLDLLSGFVEGGETLESTAGTVLGDITDAATSVLHDIGVPV